MSVNIIIKHREMYDVSLSIKYCQSGNTFSIVCAGTHNYIVKSNINRSSREFVILETTQ